MRFCFRLLWKVFVVYLLFAVIGSTIPWLFQKNISQQNTKRLSGIDYDGDGNGSDRVLLVETPADAFNARIQLLRRATQTLDIAYHAIQEGSSTEVFWGEILAAADRGVRVRILLDAKTGVMADERRAAKALAAHTNISVVFYNPIQLHKPWKWHALLHDKFIVVDTELAILGGRNIGDRYFAPVGYTKEITNDRDVLVWNEGESNESAVMQIIAYMENLLQLPDIALLKGKENEKLLEALRAAPALYETANPTHFQRSMQDYLDATVPTAKVTLIQNPIHTGMKEPELGYLLRELALASKQQVLVQTPYMTANRKLLESMGQTAAGTELTILTNSLASSPNYPAFSNYYTQRKKFLQTGASIWEYQSSHSIHGKSLVIDGRISAVGSFNLDDRSMYIDTETMLIIDSREFAKTLSSAIGDYQEQSLLVKPDNGYAPAANVDEAPVSCWKVAGMYIVSIFSRLLQALI